MRKVLALGLVVAFAGLGCNLFPGGDNPAAVLEGEWVSTDLTDLEVTLTFDASGTLTQLDALRVSDGVSAMLTPQNTVTAVESNGVVLTIPTDSGSVIYTAILSSDENTLTGSLNQQIDLDNGTINIPSGMVTFERDTGTADPCEGVTCEDGEECVDGECVATDPCDGVTCEDGEECVDGECVSTDPCDGVTCEDGEECVDGECVPVDGGEGDPAAGQAFYDANCAACHGADASGGIGPNIQGQSAAELQAGVEAAPIHAALTVTDEDYLNLEAYLATLP